MRQTGRAIVGLRGTLAVFALSSAAVLGGCTSAGDIHSANDLVGFMKDRAHLSCVDSASEDVAGAEYVICFSRMSGSQVRLEYFDDPAVGDRVADLLDGNGQWVTRRGERWIVATDGSSEGNAILDMTP